jgi:hypothetical protein
MIAVKKNFELINGKYEEVSYPCNVGFQSIGSDGLRRNQIMASFVPDFPSKVFKFIFQIWIETKNKEGVLTWDFKETYSLNASKTTWIDTDTGVQYSELLPIENPFCAFELYDGNEILNEDGTGTGAFEQLQRLKTVCKVTDFNYWHGVIFGVVTPALGYAIASKGYCEVTEIQ